MAPTIVDTRGHLLNVVPYPAKKQKRAQVGDLCRPVQKIMDQTCWVVKRSLAAFAN